MANELAANSGTRGGHESVWLALHTAEGGYDSDPADHGIDSGSAASLLEFFRRSIGTTDPKSCHGIADDDVLLDGLVDYDRKAFTLRNGNPYSDNLEQMGLAKWTRAEWLAHTGLLHNAAVWIARRAKARRWSLVELRWLTQDQIRARTVRGVICHVDYTNATGDGSHWDCGPGYPRDVVMSEARAIFAGIPTPTQEDPMAGITIEQIGAEIDKRIALVLRGDPTPDPAKDTHNDNLQQIRRDLSAGFAAVNARLDELTPPVPPTPEV